MASRSGRDGDSARAAPALPAFETVSVHDAPLADGVDREAQWMADAALCAPPRTCGLRRRVWSMPRSYEWLASFDAACPRPGGLRAGRCRCARPGGGIVAARLGRAQPGASSGAATAAGRAAPTRSTGPSAAALAAALATLGIAATRSRCRPVLRRALQPRGRRAQARRHRAVLARVAGQPAVLVHAVIPATAMRRC